MLKCHYCQEMKSESEFYKNRQVPRGYTYDCKTCTSLRRAGKLPPKPKKTPEEQIEKRKLNQKLYYEKNREKIIARSKQQQIEKQKIKNLHKIEKQIEKKIEIKPKIKKSEKLPEKLKITNKEIIDDCLVFTIESSYQHTYHVYYYFRFPKFMLVENLGFMGKTDKITKLKLKSFVYQHLQHA